MTSRAVWLPLLLGTFLLTGCEVKDSESSSSNTSATTNSPTENHGESSNQSKKLSGAINIDGSSTVYPVSQAVAEEFQKLHPETRPTVAKSGTGGGFKKFVLGEVDINDASRPIKDSEREMCAKNGIKFIELTVAIDGLSVVVNSENDFCKQLTVADLNKIWDPDKKASKWNEIDPSWPEEAIKLYGPDTDSGTFDYFTETVNGEGGRCRSDYTPSAEDNVLVRGVAGDKYSLGYFGYSYYLENKDQLNAVAISPTESRADGVLPTDETIEGGQYTPLSRPLFIYVSENSLKKPQVVEFLRYYLSDEHTLVKESGYITLSSELAAKAKKTLGDAIKRAQGN